MPLIDLVDDTFIDASPQAVAARVHDAASWVGWWPDLELVTSRDRGPKGRQWVATGRVGGRVLAGTAEIWLEPWDSGVLVHHYLRLDPDPAAAAETQPASPRWTDRQRRRLALRWKRQVHRLKDELEVDVPVAGGRARRR